MGPNGIRGIFVTLIGAGLAQNAPIITSPFGGGANEIIFDNNTIDVSVVCNPTHMCVSIDENYFITNRQHVMDMSSIVMQEPCEGNRTLDGTRLTLCTGVFGSLGCGLTFDLNQTHVSYVTTLETGNATKTHPNGNRTIYQYNIPFQCTFPLEELLTLESETGDKYGHYIPKMFQVRVITVLIPNGEGVGRFPVSMFLYKDATWSEIHAEPPVKNVSDTLYVRLVLVKSPENAVIQARRCWATPFADAEGPTQFTLIDNFCSAPVANAEQDPQVDVQKNGESTYAEWTSKVFAFAGQSERVYVHCIARVCFEGPDQPSCNKVPCLGNRKRRAAYGGIGEISSDGQRYDEVQLSFGPITLTDEVMKITSDDGGPVPPEPRGPEIEDPEESLPPLVAAVIICALAMVILVLLAIVVVIAKRKMAESKN